MRVWADKVAETSATTGTGALTLAGALTGYRRFSATMSVGDTCYYMITAVDGNGVPTGDWEAGIGTYSATNTLTRTAVQASSNAGAAVTLAAGTKRVTLSQSAAAISAMALAASTFQFALSDTTTALTTGDGKGGWIVPYDCVVVEFFTGLTHAQSSSGAVAVAMRKNGTDMLSTAASIDAGESTSLTGTAAVFSTAALTKGDIVLFDIDAAGVGAKGLIGTLVVVPA